MSEEEKVAVTIKPCPHDTWVKRESIDHQFNCIIVDDKWVYIKSLQKVDPPYHLTVERIPRICQALVPRNPLGHSTDIEKCNRPDSDELHDPLSTKLGSHEFKPKEQK